MEQAQESAKQEEKKEPVQEAQVKQETEQKEQEQPKSEDAQPPKETDKKEISGSGVLEILEKEKNELLDREEITAIVRSTVTPSKDQVKKLLASELKSDADLIVLRNIYSKFGEQEFKINAYVYTNKETLERLKTERKVKVKPKEGELFSFVAGQYATLGLEVDGEFIAIDEQNRLTVGVQGFSYS